LTDKETYSPEFCQLTTDDHYKLISQHNSTSDSDRW